MKYNQLTTEIFIKKAKEVHGNKYDYSKVNYINAKTKVCIICHEKDEDGNEHGEFWQEANSHLSNHGCPKCSGSYMDDNLFIKRAKKIHGDKYDYSKVNYKRNNVPVCIICHEKDENGNEHGEFWQTPSSHIDKKAGCPRCSKNHKYTTEEFLESLPQWIKDKYDFSKFIYKNTHEKSIIICPEHGEFLMSPHNIRKGIGCPGCSESVLERTIRLFLKENNIEYISEYKHNKDFHKQAIDFYLPKYKIGIECQGIQHFQPTDFAGKGIEWAENEYKKNILLDINKQKLCKENNINLIYFTTSEYEKLITENKNQHFINYNVFKSISEIKKFIESVGFDE